MFYVDFLFSKKSPLGKVWLAAHFDKKLTKSQVLDTDLYAAIEEILSPRVKLAIRLSGHLLYGIVRIYYQRTSLLLDETSDNFMKQMATKATSDIDMQQKKGTNLTIGLPTVHKFKSYMNKIRKNKNSLDFDLNIAQSRIEEITLKPERMTMLQMDDSLENSKVPLFEEELMRSFMGGLEESSYEISRINDDTKVHSKSITNKTVLEDFEPNPNISIFNMLSLQHMDASFDPNLPELELPPEVDISESAIKVSNITKNDQTNRKRKKRILLVDEQTMLDKETIKNQLNDPSPILRELNSFTKSDFFMWEDICQNTGMMSAHLLKIHKKTSVLNKENFRKNSLMEPFSTILEPEFEHYYEIAEQPAFEKETNFQDKPKESYLTRDMSFTVDVNQTLEEITTLLISHETTSFEGFTNTDKKTTVCKKFVSLLQLYKCDYVKLSQDKPFSSILITGGSQSHFDITA